MTVDEEGGLLGDVEIDVNVVDNVGMADEVTVLETTVLDEETVLLDKGTRQDPIVSSRRIRVGGL